ncbi:hypothetical protein A2U01_0113917, partial [Trifolium medium]|nr:hypothetical protein [Trifolium medium]
HRTHDETHRRTMKAVEEKQKTLSKSSSYHDMIHLGHDETILNVIVATLDTMGAQKKPRSS